MWVRAVAQLLPLALTLILLSSPWTLFVAVILVPFGVVLAVLRRRWRKGNDRALALLEQLLRETDELARNLDLWRVYGKGDDLLALLAVSNARAARARARVDAGRAALSGMNEVLGALALLGGVLVAERLGADLSGGWVMALPAALLAYRPLRDLGDARAWCLRGVSAAAAIQRELGRIEPQQKDVAPAPARKRRWPLLELELRQLAARAQDATTTLTIAPGEIVCVRGTTGSGKTSLLAAVLGLECARGQVVYGGVELTHAALGPGGRPFAWVPQDAPLVTGTVFDNVALFAESDASARRVLDELGLSQVTGDLVGPGGRPLSGGERRLVALGRALATELPVLLLDEPTEGLDAVWEQRVVTVLEQLRGRRSVLLVTHRERVAALADRSVWLGAPGTALASA